MEYADTNTIPAAAAAALLDACEIALFGVTADADNNHGRVDRAALAATLEAAIASARGRHDLC